MRILTVSQLFYPDTVGGSERVLFEQSRGLVGRGHEVTVAVQRARGDLPPEEMIDGIRVLRYGSSGFRRLFGASMTDLRFGTKMLRGLLKRETFDVAVLHHPFPARAYFRAASRLRIPSVYIFHASVYRELLYERAVQKRAIARNFGGRIFGAVAAPFLLSRVKSVEGAAIRAADKVVALSDFSRALVEETYGIPASSVVKIPGGVDLSHYRPAPHLRTLRVRLGIPLDRTIFLTVRRLVPRMGYPELLHAVAELYRTETNFHLYIGGIGPELPRLKKLVRQLGIERLVTFLGFIPPRDLPDWYAAADLFILPTVAFEGFGIATLEALASGTPVLGTPIGASPELLLPLDPNLVIRDATPAALAEGMKAFLRWPSSEREALRTKSRAYAEEHYSWEKSVDLLEVELLRLKREA